jgi:hypothetical protein
MFQRALISDMASEFGFWQSVSLNASEENLNEIV